MDTDLTVTKQVQPGGGGRGVPAAVRLRLRLGSPTQRLVALVAAAGVGAALLVTVAVPGRRPVLDPGSLAGWWLFPALMLLICLGELTAVRLQQGEAVEELALFEPAVLVATLLLPLDRAVYAAVLGLVLASVARRRPPLKAVFNVGTYTAASAAMMVIVFVIGGSPGTITARVVVGAVLGTVAFTAINLVCLSQIFALVSGIRAGTFLREQVRLSAFMAAGSVATGMTTVALALHDPVLLPVTAMPALAMTYAYRSAAQEADERTRSTKLLRLSQVLATREDVLSRVLALAREAFCADLAALVLLDGRSVVLPHGAGSRAPKLAEMVRTSQPRPLETAELPEGCGSGLVVPVETDNRTFGFLLLASTRRRGGLSGRDLALLAQLASALAAALTRAEHLERITEETSKLQTVVEQSTDGILMLDGLGTVQLWSAALTELTGLTAEEVLGLPATGLLSDADTGAPALLPVTPDEPTAVVEVTVCRLDGERRRLRFAHSAVFAPSGLVRDVVLVHDLTREHEIQRLKSDFIATVSHELRTPLTPIKGYLALLRTRGGLMTEEKRQECLALIADRAEHLARLVEDLLLASRLDRESSGPQLEVSLGRHDLNALVGQVVGDLGDPRCQALMPAGRPVMAVCDPGRTVQVLTNLVGNALKYSPAGSPVRVRMSLHDEQVDVRVTDRGPGIAAGQLEQVFEKFHRVQDPMTMTTGGSGLGLYIAQNLARRMAGDVTVSSALGEGSTFTLTLPLAVRQEVAVPSP